MSVSRAVDEFSIDHLRRFDMSDLSCPAIVVLLRKVLSGLFGSFAEWMFCVLVCEIGQQLNSKYNGMDDSGMIG